MRDPYLYAEIPVLKNKLNIKNQEELDRAQADITTFNIINLRRMDLSSPDFETLKAIHRHIFGDIFEWAGEPRIINISKAEPVLSGISVRYADYKAIEKEINLVMKSMSSISWDSISPEERVKSFSKHIAAIWKVHPFREGNTRTTMVFASQFAKAKGFELNEDLLRVNSRYVRTALVMASLGEYSETEYLEKIMAHAMGVEYTQETIQTEEQLNSCEDELEL